MSETRLIRSVNDRMIAGVCGGLATYLGIDPVLVRLAFVVLTLASGVGLALYVVLWIVMPEATTAAGASASEEAYQDPSALKAAGQGSATGDSRANTVRVAGIMLIGLGVFFLLNQLGWIGPAFWPVVLILAGLFLIIRRGRV